MEAYRFGSLLLSLFLDLLAAVAMTRKAQGLRPTRQERWKSASMGHMAPLAFSFVIRGMVNFSLLHGMARFTILFLSRFELQRRLTLFA